MTRGGDDTGFQDSRLWKTAIFSRLIFPALAALGCIVAVEYAIDVKLAPSFWDRTPWLLHDPYTSEYFDRLIVKEKLENLLEGAPDIITVGDSSGFFSLQPTIVNRFLDGKRLVNLSTGGNQAFDGYKANAEFALRRTPSIKHVVLHMYPAYVPSESLLKSANLSPLLQEDLVSYRSFAMPPSAALAPYAKFRLFEQRDYRRGEALSGHKVTLEVRATVRQTLGWAPEHDVRFDRFHGLTPFAPDDRSFSWSSPLSTERSTINFVLDGFNAMVRSYGAQLIVFFSPAPEQAILPKDPSLAVAERELARFQARHPDVAMLTPLVTRFGNEKFGQFNHISREFTFLSSARLGVLLGKYLREGVASGRFGSPLQPLPGATERSLTAVGEPSGELRDAALAFYLYTATTDPTYRRLISDRVLKLLDRTPAFGYMMEDARRKISALAQRKATLNYSTAKLVGRPASVSGMRHCAEDATLQWVQLSGTMQFGYQDDIYKALEPIEWPAASSILVPTIVEGGVRKFDGYCPEPSMDGLLE